MLEECCARCGRAVAVLLCVATGEKFWEDLEVGEEEVTVEWRIDDRMPPELFTMTGRVDSKRICHRIVSQPATCCQSSSCWKIHGYGRRCVGVGRRASLMWKGEGRASLNNDWYMSFSIKAPTQARLPHLAALCHLPLPVDLCRPAACFFRLLFCSAASASAQHLWTA